MTILNCAVFCKQLLCTGLNYALHLSAIDMTLHFLNQKNKSIYKRTHQFLSIRSPILFIIIQSLLILILFRMKLKKQKLGYLFILQFMVQMFLKVRPYVIVREALLYNRYFVLDSFNYQILEKDELNFSSRILCRKHHLYQG